MTWINSNNVTKFSRSIVNGDGQPECGMSASPYLLRKKTISPSSSTNMQLVNDRHNAYKAGYVYRFNINLHQYKEVSLR